MNGQSQVTNIDIDPSLLVKQEKAVLEELLLSAFNEAQKKVSKVTEEELKKMTGDLSMFGLQNLFKS